MQKFISVATAFLIVSSTAVAKDRQISGLELQQMQSRDFAVGKSISFPAVMTVLQDSGYRIAAADRDTGLITGSASTKSHATWVPFVGFGRSKKTPVVSAFIEERGAGSRVRLSFVLAKTKNGMYGMSSSDEEPISDTTVYRDAFEKIDKEIFVRQSLSPPAAPAAPAVSVAPASPPVTPGSTGR